MSNVFKMVPVEPTVEMIAALGFDGDVDLAVGHGAISMDLAKCYSAMLAAAPQPPALGGECVPLSDGDLIKLANIAAPHHDRDNDMFYIAMGKLVADPLHAEIGRLKDNVREVTTYRDNAIKKIERLRNELTGTEKERDQLKARCDAMEALLREVVALDPRGEFMGWELDGRIDAALSKPAGSDKEDMPC